MQTFVGPESLPGLTAAVHDAWFDIDEVRLNVVVSTLVVPLHREGPSVGHTKLSTAYARMALRSVTRLTVDDRARIGLYDLRDITQGKGGVLIVRSNFPCRLLVEVSAVEVTLADVVAPDDTIADEGHARR